MDMKWKGGRRGGGNVEDRRSRGNSEARVNSLLSRQRSESGGSRDGMSEGPISDLEPRTSYYGQGDRELEQQYQRRRGGSPSIFRQITTAFNQR